MASRRKHEDHINHESWAIPYGDLVTLLLAFFVVMYSVSSVNDGKYRVLSDALSEAFNGAPRSIKPLQMGTIQQRGSERDDVLSVMPLKTIEQSIGGTMRELRNPALIPAQQPLPIPTQQLRTTGNTGYADEKGLEKGSPSPVSASTLAQQAKLEAQSRELDRMSGQIQDALGDLVKNNKVVVRRNGNKIEVEIGTDILFGSGAAEIGPQARPVLSKLAGVLASFATPLRIEGHTDNIPIHTAAFPSNWELSAARAASVVHLFMDQGVDPGRMSVAGYGEYQPIQANDSEAGRNRNRRVVVVVLSGQGDELPPDLIDKPAPAAQTVVTTAMSPAGSP